ncbi:MAG: metal-dependent phosphohydrolase [Flammeovirgaceae bacterium]|nr:metal-dependent phosphohydrolase [Flammeovirgaceae bacterium]
MQDAIQEKKSKPGRGRETLFRATYQNQGNLIQMADNKANIIISINTMIISSIIALTGYGAIAGQIDRYDSQVMIPIVVIILSCLTSTIFGIQAARPKVIDNVSDENNSKKSSLLFFGVISRYTQEGYLQEMKKLLETENALYEHMTIDLYNQGLILKRKYNLLGYAYYVFMFGFILSVLVFLGFIAFGS